MSHPVFVTNQIVKLLSCSYSKAFQYETICGVSQNRTFCNENGAVLIVAKMLKLNIFGFGTTIAMYFIVGHSEKMNVGI